MDEKMGNDWSQMKMNTDVDSLEIKKAKKVPRPIKIVCIIMTVMFCLLFINWYSRVSLLFTSPLINSGIGMFELFLPIPILVCLLWIPRIWFRILIVLAIVTYSILFFFAIMFLPGDWVSIKENNNVDLSFMEVQKLPYGASNIVVYKTNGGATTSFGIAIRQEIIIIPGIMLVRKIAGYYPAETASLTFIEKDKLHIEIPKYTLGTYHRKTSASETYLIKNHILY